MGKSLKGLIVAAGQGIRLREIAVSKPLALLNGIALIERVITTAHSAGVDEFVVVTGYERDRLERFLAGLEERRGIKVTSVFNPEWKGANGVSVLAAEGHLPEPFVLMMSDHLFDPQILRGLIASGAKKDGVVLAVDRRLSNSLVDLDDVTRVETDGAGRIRRIGKNIQPYDAFDTGLFLATPALFDGIRGDLAGGGSGGISGGMQKLADQGRAFVEDIGARFWLDVDDAVAFEHARREHSAA
jgi:1L-myo-inositol 1-phosphate cytidylyltransferase